MKFQKSKKRKSFQHGFDYADCVLVLDFDTEIIEYKGKEHAVITKWILQEEESHVGSTLDELMTMIYRFNDELNGNKAVIFTRNLSHLFQFLKGKYPFTQKEVLAMDTRKILTCSVGNVEFRCLTLHSNLKMEDYTAKFGDSIYSKSQSLEERCGAMRSALINEMKVEDDDLYSIPPTSTGYVRRDVRTAMYGPQFKYLQQKLVLDVPTYRLLDEGLRGGNCVVNRFRAGQIIENVKSADRCSAYTDSILNHDYPVGKFSYEGACSQKYLLKLLKRHYACIFRVEFKDIELKDVNEPAPYLDINYIKCEECDEENGRLISSPRIITVITDVDFRIIVKHYSFKGMRILELARSRYGKLPDALLDVQRKYYTLKTELKNVKGKEHYYIKNKAKNNAIAGIFQQRPLNSFYIYTDGKLSVQSKDIENEIDAINKKSFVSFAWGVWTTSWARFELQKGIDLAGYNFLYADTDSVKYTGEIDWSIINTPKVEESKLSKGVAKDKSGKSHYVGVFEQEDTADRFCMLGSKKYAGEYNGELIITVAGLDKEYGSKTLAVGDENGAGLERFQLAEKIPFIFENCAGKVIKYNETIDDINSNVVIKDSHFTLGGKDFDNEQILKGMSLNWVQ